MLNNDCEGEWSLSEEHVECGPSKCTIKLKLYLTVQTTWLLALFVSQLQWSPICSCESKSQLFIVSLSCVLSNWLLITGDNQDMDIASPPAVVDYVQALPAVFRKRAIIHVYNKFVILNSTIPQNSHMSLNSFSSSLPSYSTNKTTKPVQPYPTFRLVINQTFPSSKKSDLFWTLSNYKLLFTFQTFVYRKFSVSLLSVCSPTPQKEVPSRGGPTLRTHVGGYGVTCPRLVI